LYFALELFHKRLSGRANFYVGKFCDLGLLNPALSQKPVERSCRSASMDTQRLKVAWKSVRFARITANRKDGRADIPQVFVTEIARELALHTQAEIEPATTRVDGLRPADRRPRPCVSWWSGQGPEGANWRIKPSLGKEIPDKGHRKPRLCAANGRVGCFSLSKTSGILGAIPTIIYS
jgi:hypothetical protein